MIIKEIQVKDIITKSNLPVCDYSVNPYVGCEHACKSTVESFCSKASFASRLYRRDKESFNAIKKENELKSSFSFFFFRIFASAEKYFLYFKILNLMRIPSCLCIFSLLPRLRARAVRLCFYQERCALLRTAGG